MTTSKQNNPPQNPPAFPNEGFEDSTDGMTLRDYFAAKALQGCIASGSEWDGSTEASIALTQPMRFAMAAYAFADAMLKAREEAA